MRLFLSVPAPLAFMAGSFSSLCWFTPRALPSCWPHKALGRELYLLSTVIVRVFHEVVFEALTLGLWASLCPGQSHGSFYLLCVDSVLRSTAAVAGTFAVWAIPCPAATFPHPVGCGPVSFFQGWLFVSAVPWSYATQSSLCQTSTWCSPVLPRLVVLLPLLPARGAARFFPLLGCSPL